MHALNTNFIAYLQWVLFDTVNNKKYDDDDHDDHDDDDDDDDDDATKWNFSANCANCIRQSTQWRTARNWIHHTVLLYLSVTHCCCCLATTQEARAVAETARCSMSLNISLRKWHPWVRRRKSISMCISYRLWDIQRQKWRNLKNWVSGETDSRSCFARSRDHSTPPPPLATCSIPDYL